MEDCLFSLNIPLQILPAARSDSGLSPSQEFCMADSEQQDPPFPHYPIVATLYINLLLILSTLLSHSIT